MNDNERKIFERYEAQGYDVIHTGVPDLILLKDGEIEFVEVKTAADGLRESQIRAIALLEKHGFKFRVERIPDVKPSSLLQEWRENHTPNQTIPRQPTPRQSRPDLSNLARTKPRQATPLQSKPLALAKPDQTNPFQTIPVQTIPFQTRPPQSTQKELI